MHENVQTAGNKKKENKENTGKSKINVFLLSIFFSIMLASTVLFKVLLERKICFTTKGVKSLNIERI